MAEVYKKLVLCLPLNPVVSLRTAWVGVDLPKAVEWVAAEENATDNGDVGRCDEAEADVDSSFVTSETSLDFLVLSFRFYDELILP